MRDPRGEGGQVVALVGLLLGTLLLGLGLAVDVGQLESAKRGAQTAADAAAWGGAARLYGAGSAVQAIAAATTDATSNGYTTGSPAGTTVTVASPPSSGAFAGNASYVQVTITQNVATTFFRVVRPATTVTASAVAGVRNCGGTTDGVLVIDSAGNTASALQLSNASTRLTVVGSGTQVNSNRASTSINLNGGGVDLVGSYNRLVAASANDAAEVTNLTLGAAVEVNPLTCLTRPSTAGLTTYAGVDINGPSQTVSPGIFTNGFRVRGASVLTLNPGVYILRGGNGLTVSNTASLVAPSGGVLIYNTVANYPTLTGACGNIAMSNTGTVNLSAQRTGQYAGLLLWNDSLCTANQAFRTTASWTRFDGTVYFPSAGSRLTITQDASTALGAQLLVNLLTVTQNFTLTLSYDATKVYRRFPALVE